MAPGGGLEYVKIYADGSNTPLITRQGQDLPPLAEGSRTYRSKVGGSLQVRAYADTQSVSRRRSSASAFPARMTRAVAATAYAIRGTGPAAVTAAGAVARALSRLILALFQKPCRLGSSFSWVAHPDERDMGRQSERLGGESEG